MAISASTHCRMGCHHFLSCRTNVVDDAAVEQILQTDNLPRCKSAYMALKAVFGMTSLVLLEGAHWKKMRKMFNPAFAPSHLETLIAPIVEESEIFVEKLNQIADTGKIVKMNSMTTV
jgi:cytochrome P450